MMRFFSMIWGRRPDPLTPDEGVSRQEFERSKQDYDRKLHELDEALKAWKAHEPDEIEPR
jgi:hypothetical protein